MKASRVADAEGHEPAQRARGSRGPDVRCPGAARSLAGDPTRLHRYGGLGTRTVTLREAGRELRENLHFDLCFRLDFDH